MNGLPLDVLTIILEYSRGSAVNRVCKRWLKLLKQVDGSKRYKYNLGLFVGNISELSWARTNGCCWNEVTCAWAARKGHLAVLQWARTNGCPWDERTCAWAAENGHLAVLQWARANDCPWNEETCAWAAENGHLAVLQWARANGCPWDEDTCAEA